MTTITVTFTINVKIVTYTTASLLSTLFKRAHDSTCILPGHNFVSSSIYSSATVLNSVQRQQVEHK